MEAGLELGATTKEVMDTLEMFVKKGAVLYMPALIADEFLTFFHSTEDQKRAHLFLTSIVVRSPKEGSITLPVSVISQLIAESRERALRGLQIAEEEIIRVAEKTVGKTYESKKDFQIGMRDHIRTLRDRYRNATRKGFLDSVADFELILLSRELSARLVSTDEGVIVWGRQFGVQESTPPVFGARVRELLQKSHQGQG